MSNWPVGYKQIVEFYGNPARGGELNRDWYTANIVRMDLPPGMVMYLSWDKSQKVKSILIHRKCKDSLYAIFQEIWNHVRIEYKKTHPNESTEHYDNACREELHRLGLDLFGGSFNFRPIRGRTSLSTHAFGCSLDIAPETNQLGNAHGSMPLWVVEIFKAHGWTWGGDFKRRKDFMHFQACSGY